jgi:membrane protease YdiL (CAAX protease family)
LNINKKLKYIIIISAFILTLIVALFIPTTYIQLFASPICLLITLYLLQDDLLTFLKNFDRQYINKAYHALIIAVVSQVVLNLISTLIVASPDIQLSTIVVIPVVSVFTVVSTPILEEIIFRKIIYGSLQRYKTQFSILAATISSLLFATMHMSAIGFLGYFAIGMIFCYYYHSTRNIYTTIIAHMTFNFLSVFGASMHMVFGGN